VAQGRGARVRGTPRKRVRSSGGEVCVKEVTRLCVLVGLRRVGAREAGAALGGVLKVGSDIGILAGTLT